MEILPDPNDTAPFEYILDEQETGKIHPYWDQEPFHQEESIVQASRRERLAKLVNLIERISKSDQCPIPTKRKQNKKKSKKFLEQLKKIKYASVQMVDLMDEIFEQAKRKESVRYYDKSGQLTSVDWDPDYNQWVIEGPGIKPAVAENLYELREVINAIDPTL